jgi:regulator of ribosome biosynthesis
MSTSAAQEVVDARELLSSDKATQRAVQGLSEAAVEVDIPNMVLCAYDSNIASLMQQGESAMDVDVDAAVSSRLQRAARQLTQVLVNELFELPVERSEVGPLALLSVQRAASRLRQRSLPLPREKPIPQPKPETRWQKFAKEKGIQKHKRSRMEFDAATGEYRPRYGYKSVRHAADESEWIIEEKNAPAGTRTATAAANYEDPFLQKRAEKRLQLQVQQKQERRNAAAAQKAAAKSNLASTSAPLASVSGSGSAGLSQARLTKAIKLAQRSTRSMGDHDLHRPDEPAMKKAKHKPTAAKRQGITISEKDAQMKLLNKVVSDSSSVSDKAVNAFIAQHDKTVKKSKTRM